MHLVSKRNDISDFDPTSMTALVTSFYSYRIRVQEEVIYKIFTCGYTVATFSRTSLQCGASDLCKESNSCGIQESHTQ